MPENEQWLAALLEHASADDRICPLPGKWDEFWRLIGVPPSLKPLILSGWAFSTDREKRERLREQITYAVATGNFATAKNFIEALEAQEWHCNGGDLDWSYGDAILAEAEERKRALTAAREGEVSLLEGTQPSVVATLLDIRKAKEIELRMLEIIDCIRLANGTVDRDTVYGFVEDMFAELPTVIAQEPQALPLTEHLFLRRLLR